MNSIYSRSKRQVLTLLAAAAMAITMAPTPSLAYDENSPAAINVDPAGVALQGFDPLSYFGGGGSEERPCEHQRPA